MVVRKTPSRWAMTANESPSIRNRSTFSQKSRSSSGAKCRRSPTEKLSQHVVHVQGLLLHLHAPCPVTSRFNPQTILARKIADHLRPGHPDPRIPKLTDAPEPKACPHGHKPKNNPSPKKIDLPRDHAASRTNFSTAGLAGTTIVANANGSCRVNPRPKSRSKSEIRDSVQ